MWRKVKVLLIIIIILFIQNTFGAFKEANTLWYARAAGMGGAFISIADDAAAPISNPAGLALVKDFQVLLNYSKPYLGLDAYIGGEKFGWNYSYLSVAIPNENIGTFGFGWKDFRITGVYEEYSILFSYGISLERIFTRKEREIYIGINLKYLCNNFSLDKRASIDPVFRNGKSKSNIGFDIGLLTTRLIPNLPNLFVGFIVKNINEPNMGLSRNDPVYREFGIGVSYLIIKYTGMKESIPDIITPNSFLKNKKYRIVTEIRPTVDITYRNKEFNLAGGIECCFFDRLLKIRAGGNFNEASVGLGTELSLKFAIGIIDYSFCFPFRIKSNYGSHKISVRFKL